MRLSNSIVFFCLAFIFFTVSAQLPHRYDRLRKTWSYQPVVQNDPHQVQPYRVTSSNLFGWLNPKHYVRFRLWTRKNPILAHELKVDNEESFKSSAFEAKRLTKVIIHGYSDSANEVYISEYLLKFRDVYLKFSDVNVIVVDYSFYALPGIYLTSLHEVVAEKLAQLLQFMVSRIGVKWNSLHVIGMSLGAQIAGIAGHMLKGQIGHITGLDPAGPLFRFVENEFRLDKSDAKFVDILHSNGGTRILFGGHFGLADNLGHVDFQINGGERQIGCPLVRTRKFETIICSHARVISYYLESISSPLAFPVCPCTSLDSFIKNECNCKEFSYMGEHISHSSRGVFYGITHAHSPFGHGPQMQVVSLPDVTSKSKQGQNKVHNKRSQTHPDEFHLLPNNNDLRGRDETVEIIYRNQSQHLHYNNEYSAEKYPNDRILQLCLAVRKSYDDTHPLNSSSATNHPILLSFK